MTREGFNLAAGYGLIDLAESVDSAQDRLWPRYRSQIPYADPAAWYLVAALEQLFSRLGELDRNRVGIVLIDDEGPSHVLSDLRARRLTRKMSPMRFPAATPSALLAVSCIVFKLRGPSMTLVCPIERGVPSALSAVRFWLDDCTCDVVILAARPTGTSARAIALANCEVLDQQGFEHSVTEYLSGRHVAAG
jgi:hypothetical protein